MRSTWGTSLGEDKLGARDKILNTKVARRACARRTPGKHSPIEPLPTPLVIPFSGRARVAGQDLQGFAVELIVYFSRKHNKTNEYFQNSSQEKKQNQLTFQNSSISPHYTLIHNLMACVRLRYRARMVTFVLWTVRIVNGNQILVADDQGRVMGAFHRITKTADPKRSEDIAVMFNPKELHCCRKTLVSNMLPFALLSLLSLLPSFLPMCMCMFEGANERQGWGSKNVEKKGRVANPKGSKPKNRFPPQQRPQ